MASIAYEIYGSSNGERARAAVWLIKHLAHPKSFSWIEIFLNDENVRDWGLGLLDQLLWTERINYSSDVEKLLVVAIEQSNGHLQELVDFIHSYLKARRP